MSPIDTINSIVQKSWTLWSKERREMPPKFAWVISSNGGTALHDNVLMFGFKEKELHPTLIAKICRLPEYGWTLISEYNRLFELWKCLGDEAIDRLPKPIAIEKAGKDQILITNYLKGTNILNLYNSKIKENSYKLKKFMGEVAKSLRFFNEMTATTIRADEILQNDFNEKAKLFSSQFPLSNIEAKIVDDLAKTVRANSLHARKKVLIHGDYWHGNMIRGENEGKLMIIDWQFARWASDVSIDVYMFLLAAALSFAPYSSEEERAKVAVSLLFKWKLQIIPSYLESYGKPVDYLLLNEKEGMLACCIEMATRPMFNFKYQHQDDLMWYTLFSELIKLD